MTQEINHNKIINQAARAVLKPLGMFQKGQSRTWIDDNGWFLIIAEFQPSNWDRGSYLNVAIHYLWKQQEYLSFDYGSRENGFVAFTGDEKMFYDDMVDLAKQAAEIVAEYRKFREIDFAKEKIIQKNALSKSHELYNKMMVCGFAKDDKALDYFEQLMEEVQHSTLEYEKEYYKELMEQVQNIIGDADEYYKYIVNKIKLQREFWRAKSSMKKLQEGSI